jgi:hypothetical protein
MNKLYRLPLRTRTKNLSSGVRRRRNSSKILATIILALGALAALVAIGFGVFFTFKHLAKHKGAASAAASPAATPSPAIPALTPKEILLPLADPNRTLTAGTSPTPSAHPASTPQPSPSVLISTAVPTPAPSVASHEQKAGSQAGESEKPLTKLARKNLEKKRLEAEHKRARLEQMYHNHEISADAYDKGKEEYKVEIQKYRDALKSGT